MHTCTTWGTWSLRPTRFRCSTIEEKPGHHMAGWAVILLALFTFLEQTRLARFALIRYGGAIVLSAEAVFLLIWSDDPQFWPFDSGCECISCRCAFWRQGCSLRFTWNRQRAG